MHMGALATIGQSDVPNFKHILINNGCHDSVGGQPTSGASESFDFLGVARSCGYKAVSSICLTSGTELTNYSYVTLFFWLNRPQ